MGMLHRHRLGQLGVAFETEHGRRVLQQEAGLAGVNLVAHRTTALGRSVHVSLRAHVRFFHVTAETEFFLFLAKLQFMVRGMGVVAGRALAHGDRPVDVVVVK